MTESKPPRLKPLEIKKDGGSSLSKENCKTCGQKFDLYRGGSWDWEPKECPKCEAIKAIGEGV